MKVCKTTKSNKNPKPFKSGLRVNTVKGMTTNPHTGKMAYTFYEDDSIVNCDKCKIIEE